MFEFLKRIKQLELAFTSAILTGNNNVKALNKDITALNERVRKLEQARTLPIKGEIGEAVKPRKKAIKITTEIESKIVNQHLGGLKQRVIANNVGVSQAVVSRVIRQYLGNKE